MSLLKCFLTRTLFCLVDTIFFLKAFIFNLLCVLICLYSTMNQTYYRIDRRIYLNIFKSTQSAARPKTVKPAANGRDLMCKSSPYYFHLVYRSALIYPPVSKVRDGSFPVVV